MSTVIGTLKRANGAAYVGEVVYSAMSITTTI